MGRIPFTDPNRRSWTGSLICSATRTMLVLLLPIVVTAQHAGSIHGTVSDMNGAAVRGSRVELADIVAGFRASTITDSGGEFEFHNLPFALYRLRISAAGFETSIKEARVQSNIPVIEEFGLVVAGGRADVEVSADTVVDRQDTRTATQISEERIRTLPNVVRSRSLQRVIATTSGVTTQNNGLLHVRGVEDGILYVVNGVPLTDRVDSISGSAFDIGEVRSVQVIAGNFPAEFGGRSGAVAVVQAKSGIDERLAGEVTVSAGSFRTPDAAAQISAGWRKRFGVFANGAANRSDRYLDPVDERNFNNHGARRNVAFRADWQPSDTDILFLDLGLDGSNFRVPNDLVQETAGQRQTQQLREDDQGASWQRTWGRSAVTNLIWYRRHAHIELRPSEFDIPITARQDRSQTRDGILGSWSYYGRGHSVKAGFEATRVRLREFFSFAITDEELAEEREVSEAALELTRDAPFVFSASRAGGYLGAYLQDEFTPFSNLTVSAGFRLEYSSLPASENQLSPRIGVAYFVPLTGTVFRTSFNRLFQPPQIENLLLSDSEEARALSPFSVADSAGGARVRAERVSAYEVGAAQKLWDLGRLDVAFWHRDFRNYGDPNTFFNTTVVFPNSVNRGFSRGLDMRLDIAEWKGFSGYLSYTNARILQTGPINGGLFLTDEFVEIGPGRRFIPDHDQRNAGSFAVSYNHERQPWFVTFGGRNESGVPLEVDDDRLAELQSAPGSDLVNFERGRVRPWTIFNLQAGWRILTGEGPQLRLEANVENLFNRRFAYNFGSPFEGTHFGHPRLGNLRLVLSFR